MKKIKHVLTRIRIFKDWYKLVWPFNRFINKNQVVHLRDGSKIAVKDIFGIELGIIIEVYDENDYGLPELTKDDWVLDVGANIGIFSIFIANNTAAKVLAIEPQPENVLTTQKNIERNHLEDRILLEPSALDAVSGNKILYLSDKNSGAHSFVKNFNSGSDTVVCITFAELFDKHGIREVAFMKMDIEAAEYDLLFNTPKPILQKIKRMALELHPHPKYSYDDMILFLEKMGYKTRWSKTNRLLQVSFLK